MFDKGVSKGNGGEEHDALEKSCKGTKMRVWVGSMLECMNQGCGLKLGIDMDRMNPYQT